VRPYLEITPEHARHADRHVRLIRLPNAKGADGLCGWSNHIRKKTEGKNKRIKVSFPVHVLT